MGQEKLNATDRQVALLEAFNSMTDEAQDIAVGMLQSIARGAPRRTQSNLRLVASGGNGLNLRRSPGRV